MNFKSFKLCTILHLTMGFVSSVFGQILQPTQWSVEVNDTKKQNVFEIRFVVNIDEDWELYSSQQEYDHGKGPIAANISFEEIISYKLIDEVQPIGFKSKFVDIWPATVNYAENRAEFKQKIGLLGSSATIQGYYEYQVCSKVTGQCVNGDNEFELEVKKSK